MAVAAAPAVAAGPSFTLGGKPCKLIEVPAAAPVGTGTCPGVRPGAIVNSEAGQCTMNFLFTGSDGRRYVGSAGHCILGESPIGGDVGEESWAPGSGPEATDGVGNRIGEFAYAVLQDPKDFALVRLDPGVEASPQMCHFGGPTGVNSDITSSPTVLQHFGNGLGIGSVLPARTHIALSMPDPDHVFATGGAAPRRLRQRRDQLRRARRRGPGERRDPHRIARHRRSRCRAGRDHPVGAAGGSRGAGARHDADDGDGRASVAG
jgi:hypothetical protein